MKKSFYTLLILALFSITAADDTFKYPAYENHSLLSVKNLSEDDYLLLLKEGYDIIRVMPDSSVEILAVADEIDELINTFGAVIEIEDMESYVRKQLDSNKDMGGYKTWTEIEADLFFIDYFFSDIARMDTIGYSLQGRAVVALKISDNVNVDEDEPEVFFNSLTHAREPMGMEVLMYFIDYLLNNQYEPDVADIINNTELWFVPLVNPDGYFYNETTNPEGGGLWRKNLRDNGDGSFGVDLNRNWGLNWGYDDLGSSPVGESNTYRGTGPFSEPETQALRDFILAHDFPLIVNYHCHGNIYIGPWGFNKTLIPPDHMTYLPIMESLSETNDFGIYTGGYPVNGGVTDWQYGEQFDKRKIISFLPEVGPSYWYFWPPANEIENLCIQNLEANLIFVREARRLWNRPTFSLSTPLTHVETDLNICQSGDYTGEISFQNNNTDGALYISVDSIFSPQYDGYFSTEVLEINLSPGEWGTVYFNFSPPEPIDYLEQFIAGLFLTVSHTQDFADSDIILFELIINVIEEGSDGDIFADECDNCPLIGNPDQIDSDGDLVGDSCDNCIDEINPNQEDDDEDGIGNACDNCPEDYNPEQEDIDYNDIGDACDFICGDANYDNTVNIGDAVYLINMVFKEGPEPPSLTSGDPNCDRASNVGDAVYLVNFVFKGGLAPCLLCY